MEPVLVDDGLDLGQFGDLVDQGGRIITGQGVAATSAVRRPALGDRVQPLRRDQATLGPAMSRLAAPPPPRGRGGGLALEANGIRRRGFGGVGGIELQPGLKISDALLQFSNSPVNSVQDSEDGGLGLGRNGVPEWFKDRRSRAHTGDITKSLYKLFGP